MALSEGIVKSLPIAQLSDIEKGPLKGLGHAILGEFHEISK